MLRTITATRYVTPLREGGSLPGLVEADDLGTYVVKFHGAGQGRKVLVAEIVSGELARRLDLPVPELAVIELDPVVARHEPDEEVQDLLRASAGRNLAMDFLPGALGYDPLAHHVDPLLASRVLWFDALVSNVDRSWRNPNLLVWHGALQLIDHGATLFFHHDWSRAERLVERPYEVGDHVLSGAATRRTEAAEQLAPRVTGELLDDALAQVPDEWLEGEPGFGSPDDVRAAYRDHLLRRVDARKRWQP